MQNVLYFLFEKAYINITNTCTNSCKFCVRDIKDDVSGACLWLENENIRAKDVISEIEKNIDKIKIKNELVFCGYGEPLVKFKEVLEISKYVKENYPEIKIRINTNGHGNYINKKNIVPELKKYIDSISISLNAQNEELYNSISCPKFKGAYNEMLNFAKECTKSGIDTTMSVVSNYKPELYKIDLFECEKISKEINAAFKNREWIENGYN